jgi:hypothetical protein
MMTENHNKDPKHDRDKAKPSPAEMHRKAAENLRKAAEKCDEAARQLDSGALDKAQGFALHAHAFQPEGTHKLNEAIKHQTDVKKKDDRPSP